MAKITLTKQGEVKATPFNVELVNKDTGEVETHNYTVRRLGGKAAMKVQLLNAEFARDKKRDEIVGSSMIKEILDYVTPVDNAPELIDLFDVVDETDLQKLVEGLVEAARDNSVDAAAKEAEATPA